MNNKTDTAKSYSSAIFNNLPKSRVEIVGSIPSEIWEKFRAEALKNINQSVTIDGFRKGFVPENILIAKVGESSILEEMAELALSRAFVEIVVDNKIDSIGRPEITVTKLAKDNPLEFKAIVAVIPKVSLPDCKAIAQKEITVSKPETFEVGDKEVDEAISRIKKNNPEFTKNLDNEKNIGEFKTKVKEILVQDKKDQAQEKLRIRIADAIIDKTELILPDVLIESELNRTQAQFEKDLEKMGVKMEDYLKHAKKNLEEIKKEWTPHAEKKAKLQLILNAISEAQNLKPDPKEVESEVNHILEHYKSADHEQAHVYAETVLTNEKVFQWLEKR